MEQVQKAFTMTVDERIICRLFVSWDHLCTLFNNRVPNPQQVLFSQLHCIPNRGTETDFIKHRISTPGGAEAITTKIRLYKLNMTE